MILLACLHLALAAEMKTDGTEAGGREPSVEAGAIRKDRGQIRPLVPSLSPGHGVFQKGLASPPAALQPPSTPSAISQFVPAQVTAHRSPDSEHSAQGGPGETPFLHSFIHSFIQKRGIEHLVYTRH